MASGSYERKQFVGAAKPTSLQVAINESATELLLASYDGWPDGASGPFVVCVDRGTALEEKMLCLSRTTNVVTVGTRGYDDTVPVAHGTSSGGVEHVIDASTIDQANRIANLMTDRGQLLGHNGVNNTAVTAPTNDGHVLVSDTTAADGTGLKFTSFTETIQDAVGVMVTGNTENGISVTYDDAANKLNFDVADPTLTFTGNVTGSGQIVNLGNKSFEMTIANNVVTNTALRDSTNLSVIGRAANSAGDPADIVASTNGHVLRRSGNVLGFGTIDGSSIAADAVALGSQTTGNYVASVSGGSYISVSGTAGEGWTPTITATGLLPTAGGTMSGDITFSRSGLFPITLEHKNSSNPNRGMIRFGNGVNDQDIACADLFAGGNIYYGGAVIPSSSRTIKNNIKDFVGASSIIDALRLVTYALNAQPEMGEQIGLVAEEVLEVDSRLAVDSDVPGLNLMSLLGLALAGLQEANGRIAALEAQLAG